MEVKMVDLGAKPTFCPSQAGLLRSRFRIFCDHTDAFSFLPLAAPPHYHPVS